jgi:hypothetical protein
MEGMATEADTEAGGVALGAGEQAQTASVAQVMSRRFIVCFLVIIVA